MPYVFGLAVVIAVVQLVIGGMEYALSEGLTKKEDAKGRIWAAIGGLMLALLSWLILNTINPDFVNPKALNIQALPNTPGAPAGGTIFSSGAGGNTCTGGGGCVSGICNAGTCAPVATNRPSGASCGQHSQCTSGSCTFKTPPGSFTCD
jgi:hypothetical protein